MTEYLIRRVLLLVPTTLGCLFLIFILINIMPGDIVSFVLGGEQSVRSPELIAAIRSEMGLDKPLYIRFIDWLWGVLRLDLGNSLYFGTPVFGELMKRLPITATLMVMAITLSTVLCVPLGVLMALKRDSFLDYALRIFLIGGVSIPNFWVAILVVLILVYYFHWLPPMDYATVFTDPWASIQQLLFPALVLGYRPVAAQARVMRSMMLEVLGEDYVRTARAKGLPERTVIWLHALKNASLPVITMLGMEAAFLMGGTVLIEQIFRVPGLGSLLIKAIDSRDLPIVTGIVLVIVLAVVLSNLLVDIIYSFVDPRIRYGRRTEG